MSTPATQSQEVKEDNTQKCASEEKMSTGVHKVTVTEKYTEPVLTVVASTPIQLLIEDTKKAGQSKEAKLKSQVEEITIEAAPTSRSNKSAEKPLRTSNQSKDSEGKSLHKKLKLKKRDTSRDSSKEHKQKNKKDCKLGAKN